MSNSLVSALTAAVQAVLAAFVLLGIINLTEEQLAGVIVAVSSLLAVVVVWRGSATTGPVAPENKL